MKVIELEKKVSSLEKQVSELRLELSKEKYLSSKRSDSIEDIRSIVSTLIELTKTINDKKILSEDKEGI